MHGKIEPQGYMWDIECFTSENKTWWQKQKTKRQSNAKLFIFDLFMCVKKGYRLLYAFQPH